MNNLDQHGAVIAIFAMDECPACEHYVPRFLAEVDALRSQGYPFVVYAPGQLLPSHVIPVLVFDAATEDPNVQRFADRFNVTATPTTILMTRGGGNSKYEGSLANNQIIWLLMMANEVNR